RLDMAQFRELAAFAQFGSDQPDKATQGQLARGQRLTEILKQDQYAPLSVERQVLSRSLATSGLLDSIPVPQVRRFATDCTKFIAAARLRRAQEAALAARPYADELARVLRSTMARIDEPEHALLAKRPEERVLVIVLTGERGLAGAFNSNILRKASELFRKNS